MNWKDWKRKNISITKSTKSCISDEIVLMPKNADCIFAYWEISQDTHEKLNQEEYIIKLKEVKS